MQMSANELRNLIEINQLILKEINMKLLISAQLE